MNRSRSFQRALVISAVVLAGCAPPLISQAPKPESNAAQALPPPPALVPQPEGTPLPPRDPRIADSWPPEIKQLIDNMLSLFTKGKPPPNTAEVARRMGITLTERPPTEDEKYFSSKRFVVSNTRFMLADGTPMVVGLKENYYISNGRNTGGIARQILTLVTSPLQSGFCLDPYELAVYTGTTFLNGDNTVHADIRIWAPAYVWGMFDWSKTGRYLSPQGFSMVVGVNSPDQKIEPGRTNCVHTITVNGVYPSEE